MSRVRHEEGVKMDTRRPDISTRDRPPRIGPAGRVARALGALVIGAVAFEWLDAGIGWFSKSSTPTNPVVWAVLALGVYYGLYQLIDFGFGPPWGKRAVIGFAGLLTVIAMSTLLTEGALWAAPLTWLLYVFSVSFLFAVAVSYLVSLLLGTPGCEVGGLAELIRRIRRRPGADERDAMWCVAGLHRLDEWEADRRHRGTERTQR